MNNLFFYIRIIINYIRYKFIFNKSEKFLIEFGASIYGGGLINIGSNFSARYGLRMEAFGNKGDLKILIGNNVSCGENLHIGAINKITIGNNVLFGSRIIVIDHNHGKYNGNEQSSPQESPSKRILHTPGCIEIGDNVWVGDGVVILGGVIIGAGSVIGANTVVNKNIEKNTIVAGNPMKVVKKFDKVENKWIKI